MAKRGRRRKRLFTSSRYKRAPRTQAAKPGPAAVLDQARQTVEDEAQTPNDNNDEGVVADEETRGPPNLELEEEEEPEEDEVEQQQGENGSGVGGWGVRTAVMEGVQTTDGVQKQNVRGNNLNGNVSSSSDAATMEQQRVIHFDLSQNGNTIDISSASSKIMYVTPKRMLSPHEEHGTRSQNKRVKYGAVHQTFMPDQISNIELVPSMNVQQSFTCPSQRQATSNSDTIILNVSQPSVETVAPISSSSLCQFILQPTSTSVVGLAPHGSASVDNYPTEYPAQFSEEREVQLHIEEDDAVNLGDHYSILDEIEGTGEGMTSETTPPLARSSVPQSSPMTFINGQPYSQTVSMPSVSVPQSAGVSPGIINVIQVQNPCSIPSSVLPILSHPQVGTLDTSLPRGVSLLSPPTLNNTTSLVTLTNSSSYLNSNFRGVGGKANVVLASPVFSPTSSSGVSNAVSNNTAALAHVTRSPILLNAIIPSQARGFTHYSHANLGDNCQVSSDVCAINSSQQSSLLSPVSSSNFALVTPLSGLSSPPASHFNSVAETSAGITGFSRSTPSSFQQPEGIVYSAGNVCRTDLHCVSSGNTGTIDLVVDRPNCVSFSPQLSCISAVPTTILPSAMTVCKASPSTVYSSFSRNEPQDLIAGSIHTESSLLSPPSLAHQQQTQQQHLPQQGLQNSFTTGIAGYPLENTISLNDKTASRPLSTGVTSRPVRTYSNNVNSNSVRPSSNAVSCGNQEDLQVRLSIQEAGNPTINKELVVPVLPPVGSHPSPQTRQVESQTSGYGNHSLLQCKLEHGTETPEEEEYDQELDPVGDGGSAVEGDDPEQEQILSGDAQLQSVASLLNLFGDGQQPLPRLPKEGVEDEQVLEGQEEDQDDLQDDEEDPSSKAGLVLEEHASRGQTKPFRQLRMKVEEDSEGAEFDLGSLQRRRRIAFTPRQYKLLQTTFEHNNFPEPAEQRSIAQQLGAPYRSIKMWFQNKRAAVRKRLGPDAPRAAGSPRTKYKNASDANSCFYCDLCPAAFIALPFLKRHKDFHKVKTFNCSDCSAAFTHPDLLVTHTRARRCREGGVPSVDEHQGAPVSRGGALGGRSRGQRVVRASGHIEGTHGSSALEPLELQTSAGSVGCHIEESSANTDFGRDSHVEVVDLSTGGSSESSSPQPSSEEPAAFTKPSLFANQVPSAAVTRPIATVLNVPKPHRPLKFLAHNLSTNSSQAQAVSNLHSPILAQTLSENRHASMNAMPPDGGTDIINKNRNYNIRIGTAIKMDSSTNEPNYSTGPLDMSRLKTLLEGNAVPQSNSDKKGNSSSDLTMVSESMESLIENSGDELEIDVGHPIDLQTHVSAEFSETTAMNLRVDDVTHQSLAHTSRPIEVPFVTGVSNQDTSVVVPDVESKLTTSMAASVSIQRASATSLSNPVPLLAVLQQISTSKNYQSSQTNEVQDGHGAVQGDFDSAKIKQALDIAGQSQTDDCNGNENTVSDQDQSNLLYKIAELHKALGQNVNVNVRNQLLQHVFINQIKQQQHKQHQNQLLQKLGEYYTKQSHQKEEPSPGDEEPRTDGATPRKTNFADYAANLQQALASRLKDASSSCRLDLPVYVKKEKVSEKDESNRLNYGNLTIFPIKCKPKVEFASSSQPIDLSSRASESSHPKVEDNAEEGTPQHNDVLGTSEGAEHLDQTQANARQALLTNFQQNLLQILANQNSTTTKNSSDASGGKSASTLNGLSLLPFLATALGGGKPSSSALQQNLFNANLLLKAAACASSNRTEEASSQPSDGGKVLQILQKNLAHAISNNSSVPDALKEHVFNVLVSQMVSNTDRDRNGGEEGTADSSTRDVSGSNQSSEGQDSAKGNSGRPQRRRTTVFSESQHRILYQHFTHCNFPEPAMFRILAKLIGLDAAVIKIWFQNERSRQRKRASFMIEGNKTFSDKPYKCMDCDMSFAMATFLVKHSARHSLQEHASSKSRVCPICTLTFESDAYNAHLKSVHQVDMGLDEVKQLDERDESENLICYLCQETCEDQESLYIHKRNHLTSKYGSVSSCTICDSSFVNAICLEAHMQTHYKLEWKFECKMCRTRFPEEILLKSHTMSHGIPAPAISSVNRYRSQTQDSHKKVLQQAPVNTSCSSTSPSNSLFNVSSSNTETGFGMGGEAANSIGYSKPKQELISERNDTNPTGIPIQVPIQISTSQVTTTQTGTPLAIRTTDSKGRNFIQLLPVQLVPLIPNDANTDTANACDNLGGKIDIQGLLSSQGNVAMGLVNSGDDCQSMSSEHSPATHHYPVIPKTKKKIPDLIPISEYNNISVKKETIYNTDSKPPTIETPKECLLAIYKNTEPKLINPIQFQSLDGKPLRSFPKKLDDVAEESPEVVSTSLQSDRLMSCSWAKEEVMAGSPGAVGSEADSTTATEAKNPSEGAATTGALRVRASEQLTHRPADGDADLQRPDDLDAMKRESKLYSILSRGLKPQRTACSESSRQEVPGGDFENDDVTPADVGRCCDESEGTASDDELVIDLKDGNNSQDSDEGESTGNKLLPPVTGGNECDLDGGQKDTSSSAELKVDLQTLYKLNLAGLSGNEALKQKFIQILQSAASNRLRKEEGTESNSSFVDNGHESDCFSPPGFEGSSHSPYLQESPDGIEDDDPESSLHGGANSLAGGDTNERKDDQFEFKKFRNRREYTQEEQLILLSHFQHNHFPPTRELKLLARRLDITHRQIMHWFQNRRSKERKALPYSRRVSRQCLDCKATFVHDEGLDNHKSASHNPASVAVQFGCPVKSCLMTFPSAVLLQTHELLHDRRDGLGRRVEQPAPNKRARRILPKNIATSEAGPSGTTQSTSSPRSCFPHQSPPTLSTSLSSPPLPSFFSLKPKFSSSPNLGLPALETIKHKPVSETSVFQSRDGLGSPRSISSSFPSGSTSLRDTKSRGPLQANFVSKPSLHSTGGCDQSAHEKRLFNHVSATTKSTNTSFLTVSTSSSLTTPLTSPMLTSPGSQTISPVTHIINKLQLDISKVMAQRGKGSQKSPCGQLHVTVSPESSKPNSHSGGGSEKDLVAPGSIDYSELELHFEENNFPSPRELNSIGSQFGVDLQFLSLWYKARRAKKAFSPASTGPPTGGTASICSPDATSETEHNCPMCSAGFVVKRDLQQHIRLHSEPTAYVCSVCHAVFRHASVFASHLREHSNRPSTVSPNASSSVPAISASSNLSTAALLAVSPPPCPARDDLKVHMYRAEGRLSCIDGDKNNKSVFGDCKDNIRDRFMGNQCSIGERRRSLEVKSSGNVINSENYYVSAFATDQELQKGTTSDYKTESEGVRSLYRRSLSLGISSSEKNSHSGLTQSNGLGSDDSLSNQPHGQTGLICRRSSSGNLIISNIKGKTSLTTVDVTSSSGDVVASETATCVVPNEALTRPLKRSRPSTTVPVDGVGDSKRTCPTTEETSARLFATAEESMSGCSRTGGYTGAQITSHLSEVLMGPLEGTEDPSTSSKFTRVTARHKFRTVSASRDVTGINRVGFTTKQLKILEAHFQNTNFPRGSELQLVAQHVSRPMKAVVRWFVFRRQRQREQLVAERAPEVRAKCDRCTCCYMSSANLERHVSQAHQNVALESVFMCENCGAQFVNNVLLKTHLLSHGAKKYKSFIKTRKASKKRFKREIEMSSKCLRPDNLTEEILLESSLPDISETIANISIQADECKNILGNHLEIPLLENNIGVVNITEEQNQDSDANTNRIILNSKIGPVLSTSLNHDESLEEGVRIGSEIKLPSNPILTFGCVTLPNTFVKDEERETLLTVSSHKPRSASHDLSESSDCAVAASIQFATQNKLQPLQLKTSYQASDTNCSFNCRGVSVARLSSLSLRDDESFVSATMSVKRNESPVNNSSDFDSNRTKDDSNQSFAVVNHTTDTAIDIISDPKTTIIIDDSDGSFSPNVHQLHNDDGGSEQNNVHIDLIESVCHFNTDEGIFENKNVVIEAVQTSCPDIETHVETAAGGIQNGPGTKENRIINSGIDNTSLNTHGAAVDDAAFKERGILVESSDAKGTDKGKKRTELVIGLNVGVQAQSDSTTLVDGIITPKVGTSQLNRIDDFNTLGNVITLSKNTDVPDSDKSVNVTTAFQGQLTTLVKENIIDSGVEVVSQVFFGAGSFVPWTGVVAYKESCDKNTTGEVEDSAEVELVIHKEGATEEVGCPQPPAVASVIILDDLNEDGSCANLEGGAILRGDGGDAPSQQVPKVGGDAGDTLGVGDVDTETVREAGCDTTTLEAGSNGGGDIEGDGVKGESAIEADSRLGICEGEDLQLAGIDQGEEGLLATDGEVEALDSIITTYTIEQYMAQQQQR